MPEFDEEVPVLIVGAAITGLSAAVFLGIHGIRPLVVERHPDTLIHPRARGVNARTAELYRQAGIEDRLHAETGMTADFSKLTMIRAETLAGPEIFSAPSDSPDPTGEASPCEWVPIDQDRLEHVLRARVAELGGEVRFSTEVTGLEQDDEGVTVTTKNPKTGEHATIRARYLVAADGGRSFVRDALDIGVHGPGEFATTLTCLFDADLSEAARGRAVGVCYLDQPAPQTILFAADGDKRWVFATTMPEGESLETIDDEKLIGLIRQAIGQDDLAVTIVPQLPAGGAHALSFWIGAQVAQRYRDGRVFVAGDAAHLVPPTGGFGASTGVQDAHNLAWKLASVLSGAADDRLLDTYQAERMPVGFFTMEQTLALMQERTGSDGDDGGQGVEYGAIVFGYRYGEGPPVPPAELCGEPGTRAPHVALTFEGDEISSLDLYGKSVVLVAGEHGQEWVEACERVSSGLGVHVEAYRLAVGGGAELSDADGRFAERHGIGTEGAVLVRPDGFVSWRTDTMAEDADEVLMVALKALLARD